MTYLSLFSGVEGIGLGLPQDWKCVGFSEIDKYASMVLKYLFPDVTNYGDITKINTDILPDFDVLTGGSPCQDLSIAGKRRGLAGQRSGLFLEYIRILRAKKPRYFIWENVKGALSSNYGFDFAVVLHQMAESGYALWWQVLNAKDFGVPQNRERVFVVGTRSDFGSPREVFFETRNSEQIDRIQQTSDREQEGFPFFTYEAESDKISSENRGGRKRRRNLRELTQNQSQGNRVYDPEGLSVNIASQAGGLGAKTGLYAISVRDLTHEKGIFPTLRSGGDGGVPSQRIQQTNQHGVFNGKRVRRLMPVETERLMSWPDNWTKYGINEKEETIKMSDNQRYKMCGNGVVSNVIREIVKVFI